MTLERVATAVADGDPVDWEREDRANRHLKGKLDRLREIEKIAEVHRTPPDRQVTPPDRKQPDNHLQPPVIR